VVSVAPAPDLAAFDAGWHKVDNEPILAAPVIGELSHRSRSTDRQPSPLERSFAAPVDGRNLVLVPPLIVTPHHAKVRPSAHAEAVGSRGQLTGGACQSVVGLWSGTRFDSVAPSRKFLNQCFDTVKLRLTDAAAV
jgi:hypothetical protein